MDEESDGDEDNVISDEDNFIDKEHTHDVQSEFEDDEITVNGDESDKETEDEESNNEDNEGEESNDESNDEDDVEDTEEKSRKTSNEEYIELFMKWIISSEKKDKEFLKKEVKKVKTEYRSFYRKRS